MKNLKENQNSNLVVRVATSNNFNFSKNEIDDYNKIKEIFPLTFVNSHIKTKLTDSSIPVIVTLNPNITDYRNLTGAGNIKAFRIKYIHSTIGIKAFIESVKIAKQLDKKILITLFRAKKNTTKELFGMHEKYYGRNANFFRLNEIGKKIATRTIETICKKLQVLHLLNFCDKSGNGCAYCGNCAKLTFNQNLPIYEINLSSSGHCRFNCVDCFAKCLIIKNQGKMKCNVIKQNNKQKNSKFNNKREYTISNLIPITLIKN